MLRKNQTASEPSSFTDSANAEGLEHLFDTSQKKSPKKKIQTDESEYDADAKPGSYVPKRRWYCVQREQGCRGRADFVGWEQLENHPACPTCGSDMRWYQWLVRV